MGENGEQVRASESERGEIRGGWEDAPTGFLLLPTLCLPAGERFRSAVLKLPSGGFHALCVCVYKSESKC